MIIGSEEDVRTWTNEPTKLKLLQQKSCEKLINVIQRVREPIEPTYFRKPYRWNQVNIHSIHNFINLYLNFHFYSRYQLTSSCHLYKRIAWFYQRRKINYTITLIIRVLL